MNGPDARWIFEPEARVLEAEERLLRALERLRSESETWFAWSR